MPYQSNPIRRASDRDLSRLPDQVFNGPDRQETLTPASQGPVVAIRVGWEPLAAAYRERWDVEEEICNDDDYRRR